MQMNMPGIELCGMIVLTLSAPRMTAGATAMAAGRGQYDTMEIESATQGSVLHNPAGGSFQPPLRPHQFGSGCLGKNRFRTDSNGSAYVGNSKE